MVGAKATQRGLACCDQVAAAVATGVGVFSHWEVNLGGKDHSLAGVSLAQRRPDNLLAAPTAYTKIRRVVAVDIGGVDKVHPPSRAW